MVRGGGVGVDKMILELKYNNKNYKISYNETKEKLIFKDENGSSIYFIRNIETGGFCIFIDDIYGKKIQKKYSKIRGINAYTLAPEQIKILLNWINKKYK